MNKKAVSIIAACAAMVFTSACSDSSSSGPASGAQSAPTSMAGSSFAFNPTIDLIDNANFVYTNTEVGSSFPDGVINGFYTFTRDTDTQVTITLNAAGIGGSGVDTIDVILRNFQGTPSSITSFDVTVDGATYAGAVVSGAVVPKPDPAGGGNGGGSGNIPNDPNVTPATIDPGFVGLHTLTYFETATPSPFTDGQQVTFEITADGRLIFEGTTLTGPFFLYGNTFEVIWYDGVYGYAASGDGSLNEINIGAGYDYQGNFTFLGQFNDK